MTEMPDGLKVLLWFSTFVIGFMIGLTLANAGWRAMMIERDYGLYCPQDGEFAFKGECDE